MTCPFRRELQTTIVCLSWLPCLGTFLYLFPFSMVTVSGLGWFLFSFHYPCLCLHDTTGTTWHHGTVLERYTRALGNSHLDTRSAIHLTPCAITSHHSTFYSPFYYFVFLLFISPPEVMFLSIGMFGARGYMSMERLHVRRFVIWSLPAAAEERGTILLEFIRGMFRGGGD